VADVLGPGPIQRDTVRVVAVEGHPRHVLLHESVGALLLVVGSRSHNELAGVLLGSVALHCATGAPCPVLVVHAPSAGRSRPAAVEAASGAAG
jgi:nucleotide-binding universal stress UspA family protein